MQLWWKLEFLALNRLGLQNSFPSNVTECVFIHETKILVAPLSQVSKTLNMLKLTFLQ